MGNVFCHKKKLCEIKNLMVLLRPTVLKEFLAKSVEYYFFDHMIKVLSLNFNLRVYFLNSCSV